MEAAGKALLMAATPAWATGIVEQAASYTAACGYDPTMASSTTGRGKRVAAWPTARAYLHPRRRRTVLSEGHRAWCSDAAQAATLLAV